MEIVEFNQQLHTEQAIKLWKKTLGYNKPHNEPHMAIDKKLAVNDGLFFVATEARKVLGTIMAGYDGHRGWIYSLAVNPDAQKRGIGSELLAHAEKKLIKLGCVKINLQIMDNNEAVQYFYKSNGYRVEKRVSMGKIIRDNV